MVYVNVRMAPTRTPVSLTGVLNSLTPVRTAPASPEPGFVMAKFIVQMGQTRSIAKESVQHQRSDVAMEDVSQVSSFATLHPHAVMAAMKKKVLAFKAQSQLPTVPSDVATEGVVRPPFSVQALMAVVTTAMRRTALFVVASGHHNCNIVNKLLAIFFFFSINLGLLLHIHSERCQLKILNSRWHYLLWDIITSCFKYVQRSASKELSLVHLSTFLSFCAFQAR